MLTKTAMIGEIPIRLQPTPLARRFHQICTAAMAQALSGEDLTPLQYSAFPYLRDDSGLDQISLAKRLGIDRTNVGLLVDQLESRKLIERRPDPNDKRVNRLYLTRRGMELQDRIRPTTRRAQFKIFECLSAREQRMLIALLVRVLQANESLAKPGLGRRKRSRASSIQPVRANTQSNAG